MTGDDLRKHVLVWLLENHNLRPDHHAWRTEVARRLVCDEMNPAWDELVRHGATDGRHVLSLVIDAAEDAHRECVRLTAKEESGQHDDPQLKAFVRCLAEHFEKRYDGRLTASVARIAATTYGEPVTQEQIERILRAEPE